MPYQLNNRPTSILWTSWMIATVCLTSVNREFLMATSSLTLIWFSLFIHTVAAEDGIDGCTVKDVLIFLTGSSHIPPAGFTKRPTVVFNHDASRLLATASTCDLVLRLPVNNQDYQSFKSNRVLPIKGHDGFGGP